LGPCLLINLYQKNFEVFIEDSNRLKVLFVFLVEI
jgi:hypothetical protein